jgi:hypothetical protein
MSDLPAEEVSYQAVVSEYFLGLRGAGLMLSPLDQELVAEWERRGLPAPIVCRGIRHGMEALADGADGARATRTGPVRSLRALRHAVEDEWRAYQSGRVGDAPAPPSADDAALLEAEARAAALRAADAKLLSGWLAALSRAERAAIGARLRLLAGARRPGESRRAHRNALRAHLRDLGREAGITLLCGPGGSV